MKPKPPPTYQQAVYYGRHQQRHQQQLQAQQQVIPERTLWSYIIQLLSAIKKVHEHGQAVRMIDVSKVLVTGQNRFVLFMNLISSSLSSFR
jgi:PAB-dependent poly(A)-specific ribonuclease subunit 3